MPRRAASSDHVILPLDGRRVDDVDDAWGLVARGEAMTVGPVDRDPATALGWGPALRATSVFARQLTAVASRGDGVVRHGAQVYRLSFPYGYGTEHLVPSVRGGSTTLLRNPTTGRFGGQARLVPVGRAGRLLVKAPMLGLMAVSVAAEMAAAAEQDRKITAILDCVRRLDARAELQTEAELRTAEQTLARAHVAVLDGAVIPESVGLGAAMTALQIIRNRSTSLLEGWERVAADLPDSGLAGSELRERVGQVGALGFDGFPAAVRTAYQAFVLDGRRTVLTAAEAEMRNPDNALSGFRRTVEVDLAARANDLARLQAVVARLARVPQTVTTFGGGLLPHLVTDHAGRNAVTQALFAGLAMELGEPATAPAATVDAAVHTSGEVQILLPERR